MKKKKGGHLSFILRVGILSAAFAPLLLGNTAGCGLIPANSGVISKSADVILGSKLPMIQVPSSSSIALYRAAPCDVKIGNGSGNIDIKSSMVKDGQVICIKAGLYGDISVSDLTSNGAKPIIVQNDGLVEMTGRMFLNSLKNVIVSGAGSASIENGIVLRDRNYRGISFAGQIHDFVLQNMSFKRVYDYVISYDGPTFWGKFPNMAYDGTMASVPFSNVKFLRLDFDDTDKPFALWGGDLAKLENLMIGIEVGYCKVNNVASAGSIVDFGHVFKVNIHHNTFTNVNLNLVGHPGTIFLNGDGKIHHNYIRSSIGNLARIWPVSLDTPGETEVYNNISVDTHKYGGIEIQGFPNDIGIRGMTTFSNIKVYNNTLGDLNTGVNLPNGVGDWEAGLIDLYASNGGTLEVKNNILFNVRRPRDPVNFFINGQNSGYPDGMMTMSNNLYFKSYQDGGLSDLTNLKPSASSPVVGKGVGLSLVADDYFGVARRNPPDIGAVEH